MALDLAFTSMAQMPRITGGLLVSRVAARSGYDPVEDGEDDLVTTETRSGELKSGLSQCVLPDPAME
jgi:hypothetical protein